MGDVTAKSVTGLGRSNSKGHNMTALLNAVFLCLAFAFMVDVLGTPSGVLLPLEQSTNPCASATLCLVAPSGSYLTTTKGDNHV